MCSFKSYRNEYYRGSTLFGLRDNHIFIYLRKTISMYSVDMPDDISLLLLTLSINTEYLFYLLKVFVL